MSLPSLCAALFRLASVYESFRDRRASYGTHPIVVQDKVLEWGMFSIRNPPEVL